MFFIGISSGGMPAGLPHADCSVVLVMLHVVLLALQRARWLPVDFTELIQGDLAGLISAAF